MITFVQLGSIINRVPSIGVLMQFDRAAPDSASVYKARVHAVNQVSTEYFSIIDGYEDVILENFEQSMIDLCEKLTISGIDIGSIREQVNGEPGGFMHHGVVCRTSAFKRLRIPKSGFFHFESVVYPMLSTRGVIEHDVEAYNWIPSPDGATRWIDTPRARINGLRWVNGMPPIDRPIPK